MAKIIIKAHGCMRLCYFFNLLTPSGNNLSYCAVCLAGAGPVPVRDLNGA